MLSFYVYKSDNLHEMDEFLGRHKSSKSQDTKNLNILISILVRTVLKKPSSQKENSKSKLFTEINNLKLYYNRE